VNTVLRCVGDMLRRTTPVIAVYTTCLLIAPAHSAAAHDLVQEQVVQVTMRVQAGTLAVHLQVPVAVLADATLPRAVDGTLDLANIAEPLRIVGADAVRNLDVLQDGRALQQTAFSARLSSDNTTVEADAAYATRADSGFSARLGTFTGTPQRPVRTRVDFASQAGRTFTISMTGAATRVDFDPSAGATISRFAREALQGVFTPGIHLLMLICLLVPRQAGRTAARLVLVMLGAEVLGLFVAASLPALLPAFSTPAMLVAASAVVIAALQVLVQARGPLVAAVTLLFGVAFGFAMGRGPVDSLQFAGAHVVVALIAAAATMLIAQAWAAGALWAARSWVDGRGVPATAFAIFVAVLAGHSAVHHVVASASELTGRGTFLALHAATVVTLLWLAVALGVAATTRAVSNDAAVNHPRVPRQSLS